MRVTTSGRGALRERTSASRPAINPLPLLHHHPVAHPHNEVAALEQLPISFTVFLEAVGVETVAVELDDQTVTDQHVHPADTIDLHLRAQEPPRGRA